MEKTVLAFQNYPFFLRILSQKREKVSCTMSECLQVSLFIIVVHQSITITHRHIRRAT